VAIENLPVSTSQLSGAIGYIGEVHEHLQAAQSYLNFSDLQLKQHMAKGRGNELVGNLPLPKGQMEAASMEAASPPREALSQALEATGIGILDLSDVADTSLTSSIFTEGAIDLEAMSVPSRPTSARREQPRRRVRPASCRAHLPALVLEGNHLYKEFMRFSRGAWTVDIGQPAPPSAAASPGPPETKKNSEQSRNQMEFGGFLEFLKWAEIVPRLTNSLVAHGVYSCVSRDCAAAGLDGKMGHLGWLGFQQCVGMVAALVNLPQLLGNDVELLLQAHGAKHFGIFPSEVARQECEDGATSAFLETFGSEEIYNRFSSPEPQSKARGMTLDEAVAFVHSLRCNSMFITPSLIAQEFRKVARSSGSAQLVSPRAINPVTIRFEQFRAMLKAICHQLGPCVFLRTLCSSLASHSAGKSKVRRDISVPFDNGAPNPPHKPNPKAFLRPTRQPFSKSPLYSDST
jgi:hypothetical protein